MINQCDQLDCLGVGHSGGLGVVWHRGRLCILQWSEVVAANLALLARGRMGRVTSLREEAGRTLFAWQGEFPLLVTSTEFPSMN